MELKISNSAEMENITQTKLTWLGVAGMGIAFSISGNFSGWNSGLAIGGWGGMFFAALIMAGYYFLLTQCIAELATASHQVDGMDSLAEVGLGQFGKFFTGISIAVAVGLAVGAATSFIEAYSLAVMDIGGLFFKCILLSFFSLILLRGAKETAFLTTSGSAFAIIILITFCLVQLPHVSLSGLYIHQDGSSHFILEGVHGIWLCIPYALFMFLGVEQAANAAGDMQDPARHLPKAILTAVTVVLMIGLSILFFSTAGDINKVALAAGDPLFVSIRNTEIFSGQNWLSIIIGLGSIVSLLATAFSLFYTSTRQFFSLGKSSLIPFIFSMQNGKCAPSFAIFFVAVLAFIGSYIDPNIILVSFVFCLSIGNFIVLGSFLVYRYKRNFENRSYIAIGGIYSAIIALLLVCVVLVACTHLQMNAVKYIAVGYFIFFIYFLIKRRSN